jgi:Tol biopolymer transport system component
MKTTSGRTALAIAALMLLQATSTYGQTEAAIIATTISAPALPSNGKIAFTSDRDGNQEIYVMSSDGSDQVRLTNNAGMDAFPAWSPDGRKLAFVSQGAAGSACAIKLIDADGTNETQLTVLTYVPGPYPWHEKWALSWSPDGTKIAFQDEGQIFAIDRDGSNRVNLTNNPSVNIEPSWSPDGSRIMFTSSRVLWRVVHTMKADGTDVQALPSAGENWDMSPEWSPAGNRIAFVVHSEDFLPVLYTANADGSDRAVFDTCGGGMCSEHRNRPKWSPDATVIVFHMWEYFSGDCQIYSKQVSGGSLKALTTARGRNFQPSWQPILAP